MSAPSVPSDAAEPGAPLDEDERWLRAREEGRSLPALEPERAASYERLTRLLRERELIRAPASARRELILALDAAASDQRRRVWPWLAASALAAAAALAIWLLVPEGTADVFVVEVRAPDGRFRAASAIDSPAIGDRLIVDVWHADLGEVRIYRDDRDLIARCPGHPGCAGDGTRWTLTLRLDAPGIYRAIRINGPVATPTGSFDGDIAALKGVGAILTIGGVIEVR